MEGIGREERGGGGAVYRKAMGVICNTITGIPVIEHNLLFPASPLIDDALPARVTGVMLQAIRCSATQCRDSVTPDVRHQYKR